MDPTTLAIGLVLLLISVVIHEVMHGVAARYFGDHTAEYAGRLTLNPIPHIDPIGSLLMPIAAVFLGTPILAWAKPVPVNPLHFTNIRLGEFVVSFAGIAANLAIATVAAVLFHLTANSFDPLWGNVLSFAVHINVYLAVFNLLPIPPLDGSKILSSLLPDQLAWRYRQLDAYGFLILLVILFSPLSSILFGIMNVAVSFIRSILGV